jgi:site-specific DNA recombinase
MIALLKKMDIEVQSIEQMLDLTIPENKLVPALYLVVSEVENERRALNSKKALYQARQEGKWIGPAPKGYINKTTDTGKKKSSLLNLKLR